MDLKDVKTAYIIWFFLGFMGGHRFYIEKMGTGIFYFFTWGGFIIGWIIDGFTLKKQVLEHNMLLKQKYVDQSKPITKEEKEKVILQIAMAHAGKVTPALVAAKSDISLDESKVLIDGMIKRGYAEIQVDENGGISYIFKDLQ